MEFPKSMSKASRDDLRDIRAIEWRGVVEPHPTMYQEVRDGFIYDFLVTPKPGARTLFVIFSGDALRSKNNPPVFQRWSWHPFFPGTCLYISDPSLHLHADMGLAWYVGTAGHDAMRHIATLVQEVASLSGATKIVSYGSSGGGFAALNLARYMPDVIPVAVNPQVDITRYKNRAVELFLATCFGVDSREEALEQHQSRVSLIGNVDWMLGRKIVYAQNTEDVHHFKDHYRILSKRLEASAAKSGRDNTMSSILFEKEGGHKKAESQEVFERIISLL